MPETRRQQNTNHDHFAFRDSEDEDEACNQSFAKPEREDHICQELLSMSASTNPNTRVAWSGFLRSLRIERAALNDHYEDRGLMFDPDREFEIGEDERCFRSEYNTRWRRHSFMRATSHEEDHERTCLAVERPPKDPLRSEDRPLKQ